MWPSMWVRRAQPSAEWESGRFRLPKISNNIHTKISKISTKIYPKIKMPFLPRCPITPPLVSPLTFPLPYLPTHTHSHITSHISHIFPITLPNFSPLPSLPHLSQCSPIPPYSTFPPISSLSPPSATFYLLLSPTHPNTHIYLPVSLSPNSPLPPISLLTLLSSLLNM